MNKQGIMSIVSGFSGAGKGTLMNRLLGRYEEQYCLSVSATTRQPREGEVHGKEYFFVSREVFEEMINQDELLEYAKYLNNYYGTPKEFVLEKQQAGINVILEIEMQGALKIKEQYPETLLIFVVPPSIEDLECRLRNRGTETEEVIASRLARAYEEVEYIKAYDYIVVNDELESCVETIHQIMTNEKYRVNRNEAMIGQLSSDLLRYRKGE